mmetsp:Transcript_65027/g.174610  ORF Transcript_65027/g.174610 Transcript_65027/m.174610 type:complete len:373 (-) Transcript_65027:89-1207(-)
MCLGARHRLGRRDVARGVGELAARAADHDARRVVARLHRLLQRAALHEHGEEAAAEGVAGAVGVDDVVDLRDREGADGAGRGHNGVVGALGDDHDAGARGVLLGHLRDREGDIADGALDAEGLAHNGGLRLVAEQDVDVLPSILEGSQERRHLEQEGSRGVHAEDLVVVMGVLSDMHDRVRGVSQNEAGDVVELRSSNVTLNFRGLSPLDLVLLGGGKVSNERSLSANDQHSALSGLGALNLIIRGVETISLGRFLQLLTELVLSDAPGVGHGARDVDLPLSNASGVLGSTTSNELNLVVGNQVLKHRQMLVFGKDGVVELHAILVQESLVHLRRDVKERVADAKKLLQGGHRRCEGVCGWCGQTPRAAAIF